MEMLYQALQRVEHQTLPKLVHRDIKINFGSHICIEPEDEIQIQIPCNFIEDDSLRASLENELSAASVQGPTAMSQVKRALRIRIIAISIQVDALWCPSIVWTSLA